VKQAPQAALWFPITVFATSGIEHAMTNTAIAPLGLFYGADADYARWLYLALPQPPPRHRR
jgi:hypothetical protein